MKANVIKSAVCKSLISKGKDVLEMFYKMPCDSCEIIESWTKFNFSPDLILLEDDKKYFVFIITKIEEYEIVLDFINKHKDFLEYKIYLVEENTLYELSDINNINSKKIIDTKLEYTPNEYIGVTKKTLKSEQNKWEDKRKFGIKGEEKLIDLLNSLGAKIINLNYNSPCDTCSNIKNWSKYTKLPDGIANLYGDIFFFDAKAKSQRYFIVNERDYIEYQKLLKYLPVRIYIMIFAYDKEKVKEVYVHDVTPRKRIPVAQKQWDMNKVVDISNELEQVF